MNFRTGVDEKAARSPEWIADLEGNRFKAKPLAAGIVPAIRATHMMNMDI